MLEKIAKAGVSAVNNIDASLDDKALLKWIDKKKAQKKHGGDPLPVAVVSPQMLAGLLSPRVSGGGWHSVEKQPLKSEGVIFHPVASTGKGDTLRQQVMLAAAELKQGQAVPVADNRQSRPLTAKGETAAAEIPTGSRTEARAEVKTVATAPAVQVAPATPAAITPESLPGMAQASRASAGMRQVERKQQEPAEARSLPNGEKLPDFAQLQPQPRESRAQTPNPVVKQQQLAARDNVAKPAADPHLLEVDYAFQRWSGEHSVKVSVPAQATREANITLLPSDTRAAEALSRHMGHLAGVRPDLLAPHQEQDEQRQQQHQQQQDEDQE